jgi:hypothetical protein
MIKFNFHLPKNKIIFRVIVILFAVFLVNFIFFRSPSLSPFFSIPTITPTPSPGPSPLTPEMIDQINQQAEADYQVGLSTQQNLNDMPFIAQLPISTADYFIVYDFKKNSIRVRLIDPATKNQVQNEVQTQLKKIGVPPNIPVYYLSPGEPTP